MFVNYIRMLEKSYHSVTETKERVGSEKVNRLILGVGKLTPKMHNLSTMIEPTREMFYGLFSF